MKISVQVTKTYYKSTVVELEVSDDIHEDDVYSYLEKLEDEDFLLSDALGDASLEADYGGVEFEWEEN